MTMKVSILAPALVLAGCITMESTTRTRAANDLKCSEDRIVVTNIGGSSYRATGCSQEATYNCGRSGGGGAEAYVCMREEQRSQTGGEPAPPPVKAATPAGK